MPIIILTIITMAILINARGLLPERVRSTCCLALLEPCSQESDWWSGSEETEETENCSKSTQCIIPKSMSLIPQVIEQFTAHNKQITLHNLPVQLMGAVVCFSQGVTNITAILVMFCPPSPIKSPYFYGE